MPEQLKTKASTIIHAPAARVWKALTTPDLIKQWFFGVDTLTDWQEGSPIVHKGNWQGKPYEDKGTILKNQPGKRLVHSHWSPLSGLPDLPENYQQVSWELSDRGEDTELTIAEVNLPSEQAKDVSESSWNMVLKNLKELLERS